LAISYLVKKPHYLILAATNLKFSFRLVKDQRSSIWWLSTILVCPERRELE
jgi:hypothetical protein